MSLVLVAPGALAVSVEAVKANLRVDNDAEDALIEGLIRAATAHAERWTGIAFEAATWDMYLDAFPSAEIAIPLAPLVSVTSVSYVDADGALQTVSASDFTVDSASRDGWIVPADGFSWPAMMATINAVTIRFVAGRGTPEDAKQAIHLLVGHWYANREAATEPQRHEIPMGVNALLNLHRRLFA